MTQELYPVHITLSELKTHNIRFRRREKKIFSSCSSRFSTEAPVMKDRWTREHKQKFISMYSSYTHRMTHSGMRNSRRELELGATYHPQLKQKEKGVRQMGKGKGGMERWLEVCKEGKVFLDRFKSVPSLLRRVSSDLVILPVQRGRHLYKWLFPLWTETSP